MRYSYTCHGVCSRSIQFEIVDGKVHNVTFSGGCNGNTQGVGALVEGMSKEEVIARLKGIRCAFKPTSCPDQLACALEECHED